MSLSVEVTGDLLALYGVELTLAAFQVHTPYRTLKRGRAREQLIKRVRANRLARVSAAAFSYQLARAVCRWDP